MGHCDLKPLILPNITINRDDQGEVVLTDDDFFPLVIDFDGLEPQEIVKKRSALLESCGKCRFSHPVSSLYVVRKTMH